MTFTPNIPTSGQSLGSSKDQVKNNFSNYNTVVSQDHVAPNDMGSGKHKKSTYVVQAASPGTGTTEVAVYSKLASSIAELFFQRANIAAAGADIQMTSGTAGQGSGPTFWQSFLPGGIQVKFGLTSGAGPVAVTYAGGGLANFPTNTTAVFIVGSSNARTYNASALSASGFTANASSSGSAAFFFLAFGY